MPLQAAVGATFFNASFNGRTLQNVIDAYASEIAPYAPYRTGAPAVVTILVGNNDFGSTESAGALYNRKRILINQLRSDGFYIVDMTVPPTSFRSPGSDWDNERLAYNVLTLAGPVDAVSDIAATITDVNDTAQLVDGTHPSIAMNVTWANLIQSAVHAALGW